SALGTGDSNGLWLTRLLQSFILLHVVDELACDVVDAYAFIIAQHHAIEYHTITYTRSRNGRLGSDCDGLPLLFGHHDLPVLGVINSYGTKIGLEHMLARENALQ